MNKAARHLTQVLCSALFLLGLIAPLATPGARVKADNMQLAVIMGVKAKVTDLPMATLSRIFRGMPTRTPDGGRFVPINMVSGSGPRVLFDKLVLGMEPADAERFWVEQKIRGQAAAPQSASSVDLALRAVAAMPGAISYVPATAARSSVRIIRIEGKLPGEAGYLLH